MFDLRGDVVIDAAGRRSTLPTWLTDVGAQPPVEDRADCGFVYYGRHFRSKDGSVPTDAEVRGMYADYLAEKYQ